jgi:hypothetical protein
MHELSQQPANMIAGSRLLNAVLFQLGWFACVLGGDLIAVAVTATILFAHSQFFMRSRREWLLFGVVPLMGVALDSLWVYSGVLDFPQANFLIPIWLICLWMVFSTSLCHSFQWLQRRLLLASLLGAIAGPSSYLAGAAMADVVIAEPRLISIVLMSLAWSLLFPLMLFIARGIYDG